MKYKPQYFNYIFWGAIVIAMFWLGRSCQCGKPKPVEIVKVKIDTVWQKQDTFTSYVPKPYKVTVPYKVEVPQNNDSLILAMAIKDGLISNQSDSLSILRDYLTKRYYYDSFAVKYGKIYVKDTVFANTIIGKGVAASFSIPTITKTVTIEAQKRTVVLFGFEAMGNTTYPLSATGISLNLKTKTDKIYGIKGMLLRDGSPIYGGQLLMPIKLKK